MDQKVLQVLRALGIFVFSHECQVNLRSLMPIVARLGSIHERIHSDPQLAGLYPQTCHPHPIWNHLDFGASKVEAGYGAGLRPGQYPHNLTEYHLAQLHQTTQVADAHYLDVDRSSFAHPLEQTGLGHHSD